MPRDLVRMKTLWREEICPFTRQPHLRLAVACTSALRRKTFNRQLWRQHQSSRATRTQVQAGEEGAGSGRALPSCQRGLGSAGSISLRTVRIEHWISQYHPGEEQGGEWGEGGIATADLRHLVVTDPAREHTRVEIGLNLTHRMETTAQMCRSTCRQLPPRTSTQCTSSSLR